MHPIVVDHIDPQHRSELAALFRAAWWLTDRTDAETTRVLRESDLVFGVLDSGALVCQPELVPFYRRFGFTDDVGQSLLMRRSSAASS